MAYNPEFVLDKYYHPDSRVSSFDLESKKSNLFYEVQLESFSRWWSIDKNRFKLSNLSFRVENQAIYFFQL